MRILPYGEAVALAQADHDERFREATARTTEKFTQLVNEQYIWDAFTFGSTQFGDYNPLSDLDILVAIPEEGTDAETARFQAIHDTAMDIYAHTSVPLEVSCYTRAQLGEGLHEISDNMLFWLKNQRQQHPQSVIGKDFVAHIPQRAERESPSSLQDLDTFFAQTRHVLKKAWLQGCYFRPHDLLSIVCNVPHIAGRKTIDTLAYTHRLDPKCLPDMKKESIATAVAQTFHEDPRIWELYATISDTSTQYQQQLLSEAPMLTEEEYNQAVITSLEANLPRSIELLRRMQEGYRHIYNSTARGIFANNTPYVERGSNIGAEASYQRMIDEYRIGQSS